MRGAQGQAGQGPTRRVIFLDIDGVLNSHAFFRSKVTPEQAAALRAGPVVLRGEEDHAKGMLDPAAVALLNELVEKSGAEVVISSTWRYAFSMGIIRRALHHNGFKHNRAIIDHTPVSADSGPDRGHEIQEWIDGQTVKPAAFVILDDNEDMAHLRGHLVRTHYGDGLKASHVEAALRHLGSPTPGSAHGAQR